MDDKTILLKIELDTTSLTEGAKKAEENLKKLTPALEKVAIESGKNTLEYKKLNAEVKANQKTLTDNATALQKYESLQKSNNGSLKEMRTLLSASKVAYAELTKEERENADVGGKLVKEMDALNSELLVAEKMYGVHTRDVGNYSGALTDLKKEIKDLKGQMATLDAGSAEYQQASKRAGELNDKLKEVNENTKANTGGTGFEKMSNNLGLIKDDLMNLDFAGVSEKMKQMAVISKGMTFGEVIGGVKNMGSAFVSFGRALLTNPLFLLVGAIVAVGGALKMWNDSVEKQAVDAQKAHTKAIEANVLAMQKQQENANKSRDLNIQIAEAEGKSAKEIGKMKLDAKEKEYADGFYMEMENNKAMIDLRKEAKKFAENGYAEEASATYEKVKSLREANKEIRQNRLFHDKEMKLLRIEVQNDIDSETDAAKAKTKAEQDKALQDEENFYQQRLQIVRRVSDLQLGNLDLTIQNERAKIEAKYKFLEDSANGNVEELLRIEDEKNGKLLLLDEKDQQAKKDRLKENFKREKQDVEHSKMSAEDKATQVTELDKQLKLQLDAIDIEYKGKSDAREKEHVDKVNEYNKEKVKSAQETAEQIEIIDAQLALAKAKGTKGEELAWSRLKSAQIKQIEIDAKKEIELTKATGKEKEKIEKQAQLKIQEIQNQTFENAKKNATEETELTKEEKKNLAISIVNSAGQLADSLMQISRNQIQQEMNEEKDKYDAKTKLLNDQLALGIISQANFNSQKSVLDTEYQAKEKELKLKAFNSNKATQLINATIATAVGIATALGTPIIGPILAGIAGALGAAQIAIIASQPTPTFAKGGLLKGNSHAQGGIQTQYGELEGGEAVINKRSTRLFTPLLSAINEAGGGVKFANGGVLQPMTNAIDSSYQMQNAILQAMKSMPSPVVAVEEIVNAVGRRTSVVERANF